MHIENLPIDIWYIIGQKLPLKDLHSLRLTSTYFSECLFSETRRKQWITNWKKTIRENDLEGITFLFLGISAEYGFEKIKKLKESLEEISSLDAVKIVLKDNIQKKDIESIIPNILQLKHVDILEWIVNYYNITEKDVRSNDNCALRCACGNGHLEVVKYLTQTFNLTVEDVRSDDNFALRRACLNAHLEMLKYLIQTFKLTVEDVRSDNNYALRCACENGHLEVVKYLIQTFNLS